MLSEAGRQTGLSAVKVHSELVTRRSAMVLEMVSEKGLDVPKRT